MFKRTAMKCLPSTHSQSLHTPPHREAALSSFLSTFPEIFFFLMLSVSEASCPCVHTVYGGLSNPAPGLFAAHTQQRGPSEQGCGPREALPRPIKSNGLGSILFLSFNLSWEFKGTLG